MTGQIDDMTRAMLAMLRESPGWTEQADGTWTREWEWGGTKIKDRLTLSDGAKVHRVAMLPARVETVDVMVTVGDK